MSLPVGVNYLPNEGSAYETLQLWKIRLCQIQTCLNCLTAYETDYSTMKGEGGCRSYCKDCETAGKICDECNVLAYTNIKREKRACFLCKRNGIHSIRLFFPFRCSDCGSPYKASIKLLNDEIDSANLDETQKGMCGGVPDAIHIVKCICCSLTLFSVAPLFSMAPYSVWPPSLFSMAPL